MPQVKAAVIERKEKISLQMFPRPKIEEDDLLLKVEMCGICGSDLHIFKGDFGEPYPLIPGHEFVGTVAELGPIAASKHGVKVGDKVAVEMILPCWECSWCRAGLYNLCQKDREEGRQYGCNVSSTRKPYLYGGWSEYLYVPSNAIVHRIPEHVPWESAVLTEPLAVSVRAVNLTPPKLGDNVLVVGAGPIGLLTIVAAKAAGAYPVILIGSRKERLDLGETLGADFTIDFRNEDAHSKLMEITNGKGADIVFETAGTAEAQKNSLDYACFGGTVNFIGLTGGKQVQLQTDFQMTFKELNVRSSFLSAWSYQGAINMIADGNFPVEKIITHTFPLNEVETAMAYFAERRENAIKVVLVP